MKKQLLKSIDLLSHAVLVSFIISVLLVAAALSLLRHYLPNVNEYRSFLLEQVNARSNGLVIGASEIRSEWQFFQPELSLYGVSVRSSKLDEDLHLDKLDMKVNLIRSLLEQKLYFDYVELANLDILLLEDENGQWSFANLKSEDREKQSVRNVINRLWAIDQLVLGNVRLSLQPYGRQVVSLPDITAGMTTYRKKKQFTINLSDNGKQVASLLVKTRNRIADDRFSLQAYLNLNQYDISGLSALAPGNVQFSDGEISTELWVHWKNGQLAFNGWLGGKHVAVNFDGKPWQLKKAAGRLYGGFDGQSFELAWPRISLEAGTASLELQKLKFSFVDDWRIRLAEIDLDPLAEFLMQLPLSDKLQAVLASLEPAGRMSNIDIKVGKKQSFLLRSELHGVSVGPWSGAPALKPVSGFLQAGKDGGFVEFDSVGFSMFFPQLYREPMLFDKARGYVDWKLDENNIRVTGRQLDLAAQSGRAHGEFEFSLPRVPEPGVSARLSLNIGMRNSTAEYRDKFIPFIINPGLQKWLKASIKGGALPEVGFIYHGPTQKTSIEKRVVQLWLRLDDASLAFAQGWPLLEGMDGEFLLDGDHGYARVQNASTLGVAINKADLLLVPVPEGHAITVNAEAAAPAPEALRYLQNEALREKTGQIFGGWRIDEGIAGARIVVDTLIARDKVENHVLVNAQLNDTRLYMDKYKVAVSQIAGPLDFDTGAGLSSPGIQGVFLGRPVSAVIKTAGQPGRQRTDIELNGKVAVADLAHWGEQPLLAYLKGMAQVQANIHFGDEGSGITFASSLQGVAIDLPKPFGKQKGDVRELQITVPSSGSGDIDILYGQGINAHFQADGGKLSAGVINLGLNLGAYQAGKIVLGGQVLDVDVGEWIGVIKRYQELTATLPALTDENAANNNGLLFRVENLKIKTLKGFGQELDSVNLDLFNAGNYWQVGLDHSDLQATLKIYQDDLPFDLHLHRANLDFLSRKQQESGVSYSSQSWSKFPDINVVIDKLLAGGEDFGEWEFKLRSYDDHMALEDMQASFKFMRLTETPAGPAKLWWTLGDKPQSRFQGMFVSKNVANVLKAWGYTQEVHSKKSEFIVDSQWMGAPTDFDFRKMKAITQFRLEQGNFADVSSSSTGALKVIGVFNIANIVKRLQLDFSDLTSEGLSYESATGIVSTDFGVYHYDKPIEIKSAASKIRLYGGFNMNTEKLDMTMGVTLPLASNLPWIVGLAAGLPTAAGIYIISKVLDKQVDQISSAVYRVTGDFNNPEVKFDSLFDTEEGLESRGGKVRDEVKPATVAPDDA